MTLPKFALVIVESGDPQILRSSRLNTSSRNSRRVRAMPNVRAAGFAVEPASRMRGPDMTSPNLNLLLHGDLAPLPEQKPLRAGPLSLIFEAGDLRYITLGTRELVRRIYGAVRDRHWGTVPGRLKDLVLSSDNDQFRVSYISEHCEADVDFVWRADIEGQPDGTITFAFAGEARSTFARNRIGLCVLHPMDECAGLAATVRRTNGTQVEGRFPELVAIEQPVDGLSDFRSVTYDAGTTRGSRSRSKVRSSRLRTSVTGSMRASRRMARRCPCLVRSRSRRGRAWNSASP